MNRTIAKQIDRMARLLRDVRRSGDKDGRAHLKSHGHHSATIRSAVDRGCLRELVAGRYEMTDDGDAFLVWHRTLPKWTRDDIDCAKREGAEQHAKINWE